MDTYGYEKRGYLLDDYKVFHICDNKLEEVGYHYHEFHKIVLFIKGNASYVIEGKHYDLEPGDVVLVGRGMIHRPEVKPTEMYERIILYISPEFLRQHGSSECEIDMCFGHGERSQGHILRLYNTQLGRIKEMIASIEREADGQGYGSKLLCRSLLIQLMIVLSRCVIQRQHGQVVPTYNNKIVQMINYINENLTENISIDDLAEKFFLSKYHMMRIFHNETGYSIHSYISNKRLLLASELLDDGYTATEVCYQCGFRDYSAFSRAYKKLFGNSPRGRLREQ